MQRFLRGAIFGLSLSITVSSVVSETHAATSRQSKSHKLKSHKSKSQVSKARVLLRQMQVATAQAKTLTADFTRIYSNGKRVQGQVRLMKPNFARIAYRSPAPGGATIYAASDGKTLWRFPYIGKKEYEVEDVDPRAEGLVRWVEGKPIQFFFGFKANYWDGPAIKIEYKGREVWNGIRYNIIQTTYDSSKDAEYGGQYGKLRYIVKLYISPRHMLHRYVYTLISQNGKSSGEFGLSNVRVNVPLRKRDFSYTPPKDAKEAIQEPEQPLLAPGTVAPDFTVQNRNGKPLKLSHFRGKVVVLDFWATWCGPCLQSMPHTNTVARKYAAQNVVVLAINISDSKKVFDVWLNKHRGRYKSLTFALDISPQGQDIGARYYKVSSIPTQYVIDPNGRVVQSFVGYDGPSGDLENAIKAAFKMKR